MNHYDARPLRQEAESGTIAGTLWHYTVFNRRSGTHPVGYCTEHDGHPTAELACECFRRYLLDGAREENYGDWTGCEVCDAPTKAGLTTRPPLGQGHPLCDEHRTHEQLEHLTPMPGQIMASY